MIRRARRADLSRIGEIAADVFQVYGDDYGSVIPGYARDGGVITYVYEQGRDLVGFIQIGFLELPPMRATEPARRFGRRRTRKRLVADILSVAVHPRFQNQGRGSELFSRAFEFLRPLLEKGTLADIQLTVADSNSAAARLFRRLGFQVIDPEYGFYERGQCAIRMGINGTKP